MNFLRQIFGGGAEQADPASYPTALNAAQAQERLNNDKTLFVLDVRQPEEYRAGHIPGATLIPLGELGARLDDLPKDRDILCVCRSGARSGMAARQLRAAGYRAINLSGGLIGWRGGLKKGSGK